MSNRFPIDEGRNSERKSCLSIRDDGIMSQRAIQRRYLEFINRRDGLFLPGIAGADNTRYGTISDFLTWYSVDFLLCFRVISDSFDRGFSNKVKPVECKSVRQRIINLSRSRPIILHHSMPFYTPLLRLSI